MATEIEVRDGRCAASYTDIKDWVALSGVSAEAVVLYQLLRMHVNRKRGDQKSRPTTDTLAKMMSKGRGDKIAPWLAELVKLEAVEAKRVGLAGRYIYTVHQDPPCGYAGAVNLPQWYATNKAELEARRDRAKEVRDTRRAAQRAKKPQVNPVTPISGEQPEETPVTLISGELVTPISGEPVTPISGREPDVVEPDVDQPPPDPRADRATRPAGHGRVEDSSPLEDQDGAGQVLAAVLAATHVEGLRRPRGTNLAKLRTMTTDALRAGWPPDTLTDTLIAPGPLDRAESVYGALRHRLTNLGPPPPLQPARRPVVPYTPTASTLWCGYCHQQTRMATPDAFDLDVPPGLPQVECPKCHPNTQRIAA